jgi:predicted TIM-barrel fold metal-dependent hydrolase
LKLVTTRQILFGTDFPPGGTGLGVANTLVKLGVFSESDLRSIDRENAVRLLPRFKA